MSGPTISLCVITGNEAGMIVRFLDSFKGCFDELCIVRAVGNEKPDATLELAQAWALQHGKTYWQKEYINEGWSPENLGAAVNDDVPATWPHVDNFGAARNMSWSMATCDWQLWADIDDVLQPGSAELIRKAVLTKADMWIFPYEIRSNQENALRERLFRRGTSHWSQPLHETCRTNRPEGEVASGMQKDVIFLHEPDETKRRDPSRNRRIAAYSLRHINAFAFELHREAFYRWQVTRDAKDADEATHWAEVAQVVETLPEQRYQMLLHQAQIMGETDADHALSLCWSAIQIIPTVRDAWGFAAEYELRKNHGARAFMFARIMASFTKPETTGVPRSERFYGPRGLELHARCMRAAGKSTQADEMVGKYFKENGSRFSLIHATRGRPQKAIATREMFFAAAEVPLGVEHIFAIDEDDTETLEALKNYKHVIVKDPHGPVKAWNEAAKFSTGHVLIQLSDDWIPALKWDSLIWDALTQGAAKKGGTIATTPMVLAIKDGLRSDALLCIAILNRARYLQQHDGDNVPYMFSPEYFSMYSDNEYTVRAYRDKVVIKADYIEFRHDHPIRNGVPAEQWDETYRRSNDAKNYVEGERTFKRRNT